MKDALGHGSAAHQQGIGELGAPGDHEWTKQGGTHYLIPSSDARTTNAIARVEPRTDTVGRKQYQATLLTSFNTGAGRAGNWALHNSVVSAKNWVASRSANSWNPPNIRK